MGKIDDSIRESREREAKADPGPWVSETWRTRGCVYRLLEDGVTGLGGSSSFSLENAIFVAAARTWEPRFREALAAATSGLRAYRDGVNSFTTAELTLKEIERIILEGK